MPRKACIDIENISDATVAEEIRNKAGIEAQCSDAKCGMCFSITEGNAEEMKKQAIITVKKTIIG